MQNIKNILQIAFKKKNLVSLHESRKNKKEIFLILNLH